MGNLFAFHAALCYPPLPLSVVVQAEVSEAVVARLDARLVLQLAHVDAR